MHVRRVIKFTARKNVRPIRTLHVATISGRNMGLGPFVIWNPILWQRGFGSLPPLILSSLLQTRERERERERANTVGFARVLGLFLPPMEMMRLYILVTVFALLSAFTIPSINAQAPEPAPAPSSDGFSHFPSINAILYFRSVSR